MKKKQIVIISAPSCSGKNSIYNEIHKKYPHLSQTISDTTREIRRNEIDGVDYNYISKDEFEMNIQKGAYVEYNFYNGHYYGTPLSQVESLVEKDDPFVLIIDVNGALKVKELYGNKVIMIFIMPPSIEEIKDRMIQRGENTPEELKERIEIAKYEMNQACKYDFCVVNEVLSETSKNVIEIIENKVIKRGDE